jgi:hypothetical protein
MQVYDRLSHSYRPRKKQSVRQPKALGVRVLSWARDNSESCAQKRGKRLVRSRNKVQVFSSGWGQFAPVYLRRLSATLGVSVFESLAGGSRFPAEPFTFEWRDTRFQYE